MKELMIGGLAAGAFTVLLCTSKIGGAVQTRLKRVHRRLGDLLNCCFCTSWWVSIAMLGEYSLAALGATVAIANLTVLLIHMAMSTTEIEDVQGIDSQVAAEEIHCGVQAGHRGEASYQGDHSEPVPGVEEGSERSEGHEASLQPASS